MDMSNKNYYELLKKKILLTGFVSETDIVNYGVRCDEKNLYEKMSDKTKDEYKNGEGKEIEKGDIKRLRSSAAMIFNLLGNEDVVVASNKFFPKGKYEKQFEYRYPTIKKSSRKANLDAWLYKDDCEIFIESKCMEWIDNTCEKNLSDSYFDKQRYFYEQSSDIFIKVGKDFCFSQYDACQMFKHTLAIYNYLMDNPKKGKKVFLINVVWEPDEKDLPAEIREKYKQQLELEHREFAFFYEKMKSIISQIKADTKTEFDILYLPVKDFYSMLEYKNQTQKQFVQRYL